MKDQRLLAAAALFRELYDNNKDIYDVISEFIRASILLNSTWTFNATKCTQNLETTFGFQIPDAVIKTCLKNRLKRSGEIELKNGTYIVTDKFDRSKSIQSEFDATKNEYDEITQNLVSHVRKMSPTPLNIDEEKKLISSFNEYILDERTSNSYTGYISHFLLTNQNNEGFKSKLNQIEEGLVLYTGIKFTSGLDTLGSWNGNLVVFLDTEHLFSAAGLNGVLYQQIFDDFNSLTKEVNANRRKSGSITLCYFEETKKEIDKFFYAAETIIEDHKQVDPSKIAMISIVNGCHSKSDIVLKKAGFFNQLKKLKIEIEATKNYYANTEYNIESALAIAQLQDLYNNKYDSEKYSCILKLFTKINSLRKGTSNVGIERVAAIFMTENNLTQKVAFSPIIYGQNGGVPFSTNIEFLTERLWFKLKKGFGKDKNIPSSFDVITKAKLVLSSQVNNAVFETYKDMKNKLKKGELSAEEAALLLSELRKKPSKPEDFTADSIDDSIEFLNENILEEALREKSILEKKSKDGEVAIKQLKEMKRSNHINKIKPFKQKAMRRYRVTLVAIYALPLVALVCLLVSLYTSADTNLSILFGGISLFAIIASVFKVKAINTYIFSLSKKYYKNKLFSLK